MKAFGTRGAVVLWVMLAAAAPMGCGGDEDTTAGFLGEWQFSSGTFNTQCPSIGVNSIDQLTGDKFRIGRGVDAPLVYSEPDTNCSWKMTANGNVATVMSGQSCTFTEDGITFTAMYTAGTFTTTGTTALYSGSMSATANVNGSVINCMMTGSGGLSKISQ